MSNHDHYTPTRLCPHRHCRSAHLALSVMSLIFLCTCVNLSWQVLVLIVLLTLLALPLNRIANGGKTVEELIVEEAKTRGKLIVRPGWARAAVISDLFFLANAIMVSYENITSPSATQVPPADAETVVFLILAFAAVMFVPYAHRQATRPGRPKRVTVPVSADS